MVLEYARDAKQCTTIVHQGAQSHMCIALPTHPRSILITTAAPMHICIDVSLLEGSTPPYQGGSPLGVHTLRLPRGVSSFKLPDTVGCSLVQIKLGPHTAPVVCTIESNHRVWADRVLLPECHIWSVCRYAALDLATMRVTSSEPIVVTIQIVADATPVPHIKRPPVRHRLSRR